MFCQTTLELTIVKQWFGKRTHQSFSVQRSILPCQRTLELTIVKPWLHEVIVEQGGDGR